MKAFGMWRSTCRRSVLLSIPHSLPQGKLRTCLILSLLVFERLSRFDRFNPFHWLVKAIWDDVNHTNILVLPYRLQCPPPAKTSVRPYTLPSTFAEDIPSSWLATFSRGSARLLSRALRLRPCRATHRPRLSSTSTPRDPPYPMPAAQTRLWTMQTRDGRYAETFQREHANKYEFRATGWGQRWPVVCRTAGDGRAKGDGGKGRSGGGHGARGWWGLEGEGEVRVESREMQWYDARSGVHWLEFDICSAPLNVCQSTKSRISARLDRFWRKSRTVD